MHLITGKSSWHGAWVGACSSVHQNCFLWACSLLQILSRGESKPQSSLCPSHLPSLCLRLPAAGKFSCGCMCSPRVDALLSACCHSVWLHCLSEHCRYLAAEGHVWFLKGMSYSRSEPVYQLGRRLGSTGVHAGALVHLVGWVLPEQSFLLESPCFLLLFPVFLEVFSDECG